MRNQVVKELGSALPLNFIFVLPDGVPVSVVQETSLSASSFTPTVTVRGVDKPVLVDGGSEGGSSTQAGRGQKIAVRMSEQVARAAGYSQVRLRQDEGLVFYQWLTPQYTFGQLKRDAARFWGLSPSDVVLDDGDGCVRLPCPSLFLSYSLKSPRSTLNSRLLVLVLVLLLLRPRSLTTTPSPPYDSSGPTRPVSLWSSKCSRPHPT